MASDFRTTAPGDLPEGAPVLAFPGSREGRAMLTTTRSEPWTLPSGERVVMVEGYPGGIALTHIEVLPCDLIAERPIPPGAGDAREAAALARVDALAGPGRVPVCWPMRVEGEA